MIAGIFVASIRRIVIGWSLLFVLISAATYWLAPETLVVSMLIGLASGIVSVIALMPGANLTNSESKSAGDATAFVTTIQAAMAIRVTGTVALFLLGRYQLGHPPQTIAIFVCGWYVLLTSFEVVLLAQSSKSLTPESLTPKSLNAKALNAKALTQDTESK
jgi:hypothetical protein